MTDELKSGSALVRAGFEVGGQLLIPGWKALPVIGAEIENGLAGIDWHLFFQVSPYWRQAGLFEKRKKEIELGRHSMSARAA